MLKATFRRHVTPLISEDAPEDGRLELQRMAAGLNGMFTGDCFYSAEAARKGTEKFLERHPGIPPGMFLAEAEPGGCPAHGTGRP